MPKRWKWLILSLHTQSPSHVKKKKEQHTCKYTWFDWSYLCVCDRVWLYAKSNSHLIAAQFFFCSFLWLFVTFLSNRLSPFFQTDLKHFFLNQRQIRKRKLYRNRNLILYKIKYTLSITINYNSNFLKRMNIHVQRWTNTHDGAESFTTV